MCTFAWLCFKCLGFNQRTVCGTPHVPPLWCLLMAATKFDQGYVCTRVCNSVHRGSASVYSGLATPVARQTPP